MATRSQKTLLICLGLALVIGMMPRPLVKAGTGLTQTNGGTSVATNAWTNNTNAYGLTDDNVYATAAPGQNATVTGDWGTYGFDSTIPTYAAITKVEIIPQYKVSTTASIATMRVQAAVSGTACPTTALTQTTEPTTDTEFVANITSCRTWTRANLLNGVFTARIAAQRGASATAVTFSLDYVKVRITYSVPDYNQSGYRIFQNADSTNVGAAIAAINTPGSLTTFNQAFRVRLLQHVTTVALVAATEQYKLQYVGKGAGTCAAPSGTPGVYTDVSSSTEIAFNNNPTPADNVALTANANDPTHSADTIVNQSYVETNPINIRTATAIGRDAKWDFALKDNYAPSSTTYCLRLVHGTGAVLETYTTYPEITTAEGIMVADIVNGSGASVSTPTIAMNSAIIPFDCTNSTGTFGIASQKVRISNTLSTTGWTVSIAPTAGTSALWSGGVAQKYDFNDADTSGCVDGADTDIYAGQMSIDASSGTITPQSGCTNTGISTGTGAGFVEGSVNSVTLLTASAAATRGCYWDLTGIAVSQKIPAGQLIGSYSINLSVTILAN